MIKVEKFDIRADGRVSKEDILYCKKHQQAWDEARKAFTDLREKWQGIIKRQNDILGEEENKYLPYLNWDNCITLTAIDEKLESLPRTFIDIIVQYFNTTYKVSISSYDIETELLPERPSTIYREKGDEKAYEEYEESLRTMTLRYEDILEQILARLGESSFTEKALDELKERCRGAVWNSYLKRADFEVKNDTIKFQRYFCSYEHWLGKDKWEVSQGFKDVLRCAAHFETNSLKLFPFGFSELLGHSGSNTPIINIWNSDKLSQIRMYKNGRVDLKFMNAQLADQFAQEYLHLDFEVTKTEAL